MTRQQRGRKPATPVEHRTANAWAWLCNFGVCGWAEPTMAQLAGEKPSSEAIKIKVKIVPLEYFNDLVERAKLGELNLKHLQQATPRWKSLK